MKGLKYFLNFDLEKFLLGKKLTYLKAVPWLEDDKNLGCKVTLQIIDDQTTYANESINNFGEQLVVKMRNCSPATFTKLRPFETEVTINEPERITVYGDYQNQLSIIAKIAVTGTKA